MSIEDIILSGLVERGLAPHLAQGVLANMVVESGLNPGINEIAPLVEGSRGGFGLNQWTGPRRVAYEEFARSRGAPLDDLEAQLDFTMQELHGPERHAFDALRTAPDAVTAARLFSDKFLRPGIPHLSRRLNEAARLSRQPPAASQRPPARPDAGLEGLFGAEPDPAVALPPLASPRPQTRSAEDPQRAQRRRQMLLGEGGLGDTFR